MSEQKRPYIEIEHFSFYYPERTEKVLDDLTLTVEQGEFLVLCGPSGCGKSTLLRQLKTVLAPHGRRLGSIRFEGCPLEELDQREQSAGIGFVQQDPENQIVTDKVWHELAFGLESLGYDTPTIRRRVAEMASFFGIQTWFYKNVTELSGGQKQLLNLASIMAMQPSVLILDEPTSQLDPIAAADFLATLGKINRELGTTVVLTEHRLEDAFPLASRVAVMDRGRLLCTGSPAEVGAILRGAGHSMFLAMPTPMRIWASAPDAGGHCPVTVREGRDWLTKFADGHPLMELPSEPRRTYPNEPAITAEGRPPRKPIPPALHAVSCLNCIFQAPGKHDGENRDSVSNPPDNPTIGDIPSDASLRLRHNVELGLELWDKPQCHAQHQREGRYEPSKQVDKFVRGHYRCVTGKPCHHCGQHGCRR